MRCAPYVAASLVVLLMAGCKTAPSSPQTSASSSSASTAHAPVVNPATKAASAKGNLAIEKLRLSELFKGTPVVFALQPDGSLRVEVPMHYSFDAGKSAVKPPLGAVLDRVASGQLAEATQVLVAAPGDPAAKGATLVGERSASVRSYLIARGLPEKRVLVVASTGVTMVRIVVTDAPTP
jgi:hypothetical protein